MQIIIENEYGRIGMGNGKHPYFRVTDVDGTGFMIPDRAVCTYAGVNGQTLISSAYGARTITIAAEMMHSGIKSREEVLRIISNDVIIKIEKGSKRRQISGRCIGFDESKPNRVFRKLVMQFICDSPYFEDYNYTNCELFSRKDIIIGGVTVFNTAFSVRTNEAYVYNSGDCASEPIINISAGAAHSDDIVIRNITTGAVCSVTGGVAKNEEIVINIPERYIKSSIRGDITHCISDGTILSDFYLKKGENSFTVSSENTAINCSMKYKNKYMEAII